MLLYDQSKLQNPVDEKQVIDPYTNDYIFSKFLSEEIVRLSNIYGYTKLIRPDLVPTLMQNVLNKDEVTIWNDKPKRDFIFTEDAADAILKLINTNYTGVINLGTGEMNSIKTITNEVKKLSGKNIRSLDKPVSGPMELSVDTTLTKNLIDWSPKFTLKEGLKKTYDIMKSYHQK